MKFRTVLNGVLSPLGYGVFRTGRVDQDAIAALVGALTEKFVARHGSRIIGGPFAGTELPAVNAAGLHAWSDLDRVAKLAGTYECELHAAIRAEVARRPAAVLNIGCADGYYAVALKRLLPDAEVIANDIDPRFGPTVAAMARANAVEVAFSTANVFADSTILASLPPALIVSDCEGGEVGIADIPADLRARSSFIVELHDDIVPGVGDRLAAVLSASHDVTVIESGGRDPFAIEALDGLGTYERFLLLSEFRGGPMRWLHAARRNP